MNMPYQAVIDTESAVVIIAAITPVESQDAPTL
jgi:hypothetical protein